MTLYRTLLRLYPRSFRDDYAPELTATFEDSVRGRGALSAALAAIGDVVPNAFAAHAELLRQDISYAMRSIRNAPGFAITTVLLVALGVGANTAAFSLANHVFLKPFPYPESDRLVRLYQSEAGNPSNYGDLSPANFRDWKDAQRSFSAMGAVAFRPANLASSGEPRRVEIVRATPEVLPLLGAEPVVGGLFAPDDTLTGQAILLSYALWQSHFGSDPGIAGTIVRLDGVPHTVAGVMPPSFQFPNQGIDAWAPLVFSDSDFENRNNRFLFGIARLRNGTTITQARADLDRIAATIRQQYQLAYDRTGATVFGLRDEMSPRSRILIFALSGAALCILLLACANLASLFLARGSYRGRELAVRAALGAGRERLVRQLITESLVLAVIGGALGIVAAAAGLPLLASLVPGGLPVTSRPTLDVRVLLLALGLVLVTGLAFGIAPAVRGARSNGLDALRAGARSGGGRTQRIRAALVVVEVAASVVLLISSGLLIRAVWRVTDIDPGFRTENVLTVRTALPFPKYDLVARRTQYYDRVLAEVRALPGVRSAAFVTGLPLVMRGGIWDVFIAGREPRRDGSEKVSLRYATPGYFATLGIPLRRGRDFTEGDRSDATWVAIVSESFATRHWPGEDPIGMRFTVADSVRTVVGVVGDVHVRGLERRSEPQLYLPPAQVGSVSLNYIPKDLVILATGTPLSLIPGIREIVKRADVEQPLSNVRLLADIVADETAPRMTQLRLLAALSVIALVIAGIGIHGVLMFAVSQRSQELGVRRALGAQAGGIVRMVLREGLALTLAGIAIGIPVAYGAARGMSAALSGVRPEDPPTMLMAALLCFGTALAGCVRPAARAARADPMWALRSE